MQYVLFYLPGDQVGPEASSEVLGGCGYVVQVPAGSLLRPLVHLPAHLRSGRERKGARAAHGIRCPQTHGEPKGGSAGRGETLTGSQGVLGGLFCVCFIVCLGLNTAHQTVLAH